MASETTSVPIESERNTDSVRTVPLEDNRQLAYAEYGRSDGSPVVFLHGTPGSRRLGAVFESAAKRHDVRLLAPDRPGYGRSSTWPDRSINDAGNIVSAVLDHADVDTAGLIGFSGGGPYALSAAATIPDRIERVDVISGATPPAASEATPPLQLLLTTVATVAPSILAGLFRTQAWFAARRDPTFVLSQYTDDGEGVPDDIARIVKSDFIEAVSRTRSGVVAEFREVNSTWNIDVPDIEVDVFLWHGSTDTNVPAGDVRRFEAQLPNAELVILDDADHLQALIECVPVTLEHQ